MTCDRNVLVQHRIEYPDGTFEVIKHYGMFVHSSGGFGFYEHSDRTAPGCFPTENDSYIFVSGANIRKIIPLGAV